jgi:hypothetical protein
LSAKEDYRKEMEIEIELVQVKLTMLKALTMSLMIEFRNENTRKIDALACKVHEMRAQLREVDRIHESAWLRLRGGIEETWAALQISLNDAVMGFKSQ